MLQFKSMLSVFGCFQALMQCLWTLENVFSDKMCVETANKRPTYLATFTFVHGIAISVFV